MYDNYLFGDAVIYYLYRFVVPLMIAELITFLSAKKKTYWIVRFAGYEVLFLTLSGILIYYDVDLRFGWFRTIFLLLFLLSLLPLVLTFGRKIKHVLFLASSAYTVQNFADNLWKLAREIIPSSDKKAIELLLYFLLFGASFTVYYFVFVKLMKKNSVAKLSNNSVLFISLASILVINILSRYAQSVEDPAGVIATKLYARIACFFILAIQYNIFHSTKLSGEKERLEQALKFQNDKFASSKETRELINIKCHDLKHALESLNSSNLSLEQKETLLGLSNAIDVYDSRIKTGNPVIDRVLSEKSLICHKEKIRLNAIIDGSLFSFRDNVDVYSLFENVLDNAIKAVRKEDEEKKSIFLHAVEKNNVISLKEENYVGEEILFKDGLPLSKGNPSYHGYGTKSIAYIVGKYKGSCQFFCKDHRFTFFACFFKAGGTKGKGEKE